MPRALFILVVVTLCLAPHQLRADTFDHYTNKVLTHVPKAKVVKRVKKLTPGMLVDYSGVIPGTTAAFLVVRTNEGRWCKLLVHPARQKISKTESLPILLISQFVTYRDGTDKAVLVQGKDTRLFHDFVLNLDLGQVVPKSVGGDIRFVVGEGTSYAEPVGKAEIYVLEKPLPQAKPRKSTKVVIRDPFLPSYFNGVYKLYNDGRRSGELYLQVDENRNVTGHYYSGKDGRKYAVSGKVADPHHKIEFTVTLPRTVQLFRGWMFTGDGKAITGVARMQQRETGFYAIRKK